MTSRPSASLAMAAGGLSTHPGVPSEFTGRERTPVHQRGQDVRAGDIADQRSEFGQGCARDGGVHGREHSSAQRTRQQLTLRR